MNNSLRIFVLAVLLVLTLTGCGGDQESQVTTTTTVSTAGSTDPTTTTTEKTTTTQDTTTVTTTTTKAPVKVTTTTKKPTTTTRKPETTVTTVKVVQAADPETGISWDGKSPIIYTYEDGTTGTEKKPNATYEKYPGVIYSVPAEPDTNATVWNGICSCGKVAGDGSNGTCVKYYLIDECPLCHETGILKQHHTCKE